METDGKKMKTLTNTDGCKTFPPSKDLRVRQHVSSYQNKISTHFNSSAVYRLHQIARKFEKIEIETFYWEADIQFTDL